jgi:hypothetical protein
MPYSKGSIKEFYVLTQNTKKGRILILLLEDGSVYFMALITKTATLQTILFDLFNLMDKGSNLHFALGIGKDAINIGSALGHTIQQPFSIKSSPLFPRIGEIKTLCKLHHLDLNQICII